MLECDACDTLKSKQAAAKTYQLEGGEIDVFIEFLAPPVSLLLIGAGGSVPVIAEFASRLGWDVTVVDHRPTLVSQERLGGAHIELIGPNEKIDQRVGLNRFDAAVVLTHEFSRDVETLTRLLQSSVKYVGLLSSANRIRLIFKAMTKAGFTPTDEQLAHFYAPTGLDIGSEGPEEIALAIVAEIKSVLAGRTGGFSRKERAIQNVQGGAK
jgi:xanthine/CO dehydrogenase XdhC/CoxF family maturation factor